MDPRFTLNEEQQRMMREFAAQLFLPETRPENSKKENQLIDLCVERANGNPADDAAKAKQLETLLTAAAARGEIVNVNVRSTSGACAVWDTNLIYMPFNPCHSTPQQVHVWGVAGGCSSDWAVVLLPLLGDP